MGKITQNGKRIWLTDWRDNLILDSGLDKMGTVLWPTCFNTCLIGAAVGPNPVRRDSGATTFTQVGTTVTASGNFFSASDVGRLLKYGTGTAGQEAYITAFTSATQVTVSVSASVAVGIVGTVWYVNTSTLTSVSQTTSTYGSSGGDNGTSVSGNIVTHKRTFTGTALVTPTTFTEIGFNNSTTNANLFDRDIIPGGISLLVGEIPLVVCNVTVTYTPNTSTAVANFATGYNSAGDSILAGILGSNQINIVNADGTNTTSSSALEPCPAPSTADGQIRILTSSFALPSFNNGVGPSLTGTNFGLSSAVYSNGNFYRDKSYTLSISQGNGTIYGYALTASSGASSCTYVLRFTTSFTKNSSQTLSITCRFSWQRILNN